MRLSYRTLLLLAALFVALVAPAAAHGPEEEHANESKSEVPSILKTATFDQNLGDKAPLALTFRDETGSQVRLADYFSDKPVLLTMNYYDCDNLCPLALEGVIKALNVIPFTVGEEYSVVTVSIDEEESPELASEVKHRVLDRYDRKGTATTWPFLTGDKQNIDALAQAVGFNFAWDEESQQYAHPSGVIILSPDGTISRYIYGLEFSPLDIRLALVEASENKIASAVDHVLLFCYRYNPTEGRYGAFAMNSIRVGGLLTVLALAAFIVPTFRREREQNKVG